jgi:cobyrinic acid a,c-diamide synthase
MAGVLPCEVEMLPVPQGHGYIELQVDRLNPFFPEGLHVRGHEFHYSRIVQPDAWLETACAVRRGTGSVAGRDAIVVHHVWASFTHVHALATPEWAAGLVRAARDHARRTNPVRVLREGVADGVVMKAG